MIRQGPEPTVRQEQIRDTVRELATRFGRPPTTGEIALELELTPQAVRFHLHALEKMGLIADVPQQVRSGRWRVT